MRTDLVLTWNSSHHFEILNGRSVEQYTNPQLHRQQRYGFFTVAGYQESDRSSMNRYSKSSAVSSAKLGQKIHVILKRLVATIFVVGFKCDFEVGALSCWT